MEVREILNSKRFDVVIEPDIWSIIFPLTDSLSIRIATSNVSTLEAVVLQRFRHPAQSTSDSLSKY